MTDAEPDDLVAPAGGDAAATLPPDDVLGGGDAAQGEGQQTNEEFPSPLGGAPWQEPDQPAEQEYSGDR